MGIDHGDSVESSAKSELVDAAAAGSSPKSDLDGGGVESGGGEPNRDMLKAVDKSRQNKQLNNAAVAVKTGACRGLVGALVDDGSALQARITAGRHQFRPQLPKVSTALQLGWTFRWDCSEDRKLYNQVTCSIHLLLHYVVIVQFAL